MNEEHDIEPINAGFSGVLALIYLIVLLFVFGFERLGYIELTLFEYLVLVSLFVLLFDKLER